jgi:hypothetical protein
MIFCISIFGSIEAVYFSKHYGSAAVYITGISDNIKMLVEIIIL